MKICLFDPGIEDHNGSPSANLGDLIIQEAVKRELNSACGNCETVHISSHVFPTPEQISLARNCSLIFAGGTNLLGSQMNVYKQWKVSFRQQIKLKKSVLIGVGWERYQDEPNFYTKFILNFVLSRKLFHSVRDSYTKAKLQSAGIRNVLNTGCPTMWPLMNIKSEDYPLEKAENVLLMLTDYSKKPDLDKKLLELVASRYKKIFFWPQGRSDLEYFSELRANNNFPFFTLEHSIASFENFLNSGVSFDYIGTRLHGGVKCLLSKKRSLILEIDNRAAEIAKDTKISTAKRADFEYINRWIDAPSTTNIKLDSDTIRLWRSQFSKICLRNQSSLQTSMLPSAGIKVTEN